LGKNGRRKQRAVNRTLANSNSDIQTIFEAYYKKWDEETKYLSSSKMFENIYYKKIISLGMDAAPVIINKLKETPSHLFVALHKITGVNPIKPENRGKIKEMANDWIDWWEQNENAGA
jgi:uridine kinase